MKNSNVEWIGQIPDDWKLERLQWHLDEIKEPNDPIKTTQILSLTNKLGVIPYEEKGEQGNKPKENFNEYKIAYPNTIVANCMNVLIGSVGICNHFGCVSPVYYVFKPKKNENIEFLNYIFQTTQFQKELRKFANGILEIRLRVSSDDILKREVALPNLELQNKIVKYLNKKCSQIDQLIEVENQQIDKLKEYKQAIITEAVTKGLDKNVKLKESGVEWIGKIPENWKIVPLKYVCKIATGSTPATQKREYFDGNVNWYTPGDFNKDVITESVRHLSNQAIEELKLTVFPEMTTLLIGIGGTAGKVSLMTNKGYTNQQITALISETLNKKFLFYIILTGSQYLRDNALYTTLAIINNQYLSSFKICVTSLQEQEQITSFLDKQCSEIDSLIEIKNKKIENLQQYKKSMIYEYVTGKKEVK